MGQEGRRRVIRTIYLGLFLLLSLVAGGIYYSNTREATAVVASGDLHVGSQISESSVSIRRVSPGAIPPGAARSVSDVVGRYVAWPVLDGQYIPLRALATDRASLIAGGLQVPAGFHAMSLPVSAAEAVGGVVRPGDLVDVLAVPKNLAPGTAPPAAAVLGRRVLVLGLRTEQGQPLDEGGPSSVRGLNFATNRIASIVVAVSADDEEKYAAASAVSSFTVVLDLE
jgi:Flp pilus assembly protein CpaB